MTGLYHVSCQSHCDFRYDEENAGVIDGSKFMKKLGISLTDHKASATGRMNIPVNTDGKLITPPPQIQQGDYIIPALTIRVKTYLYDTI